jgi:hypothetical protein
VGIGSKSWQRESRSREVRHPDHDESRVGHRSECKMGGGDRRSREFGLANLKLKYSKVRVARREVAKARQENLGISVHRASEVEVGVI